MASTWLDSWGTSWGDSWGIQAADPNRLRGTAYGSCSTSANLTSAYVPPAPPIEETGGPGRKSKRVYIERDGQILVFAKPSHAAEFIQAEKAIETVVAKTVTVKRKIKKLKPSVPETVIKIDPLTVLAEKFSLGNVADLVTQHDYEALLHMHIQAMIMQEEDEIEILLMAV